MFAMPATAETTGAQTGTAQTTGGGRGQRPPQTPEQQAEAAKRREAAANEPRPIDAFDSVWTEELTWMEVRDAIKSGKTTGLILTGGVESNGPHLATGKHNFVLKVMGEAIARKLGNALGAPIVTLEPGRPDSDRVAPGSVFLSAATYRAVLTDLATSRKGRGYASALVVGDRAQGHGLPERDGDGRQRRQPARDEGSRGHARREVQGLGHALLFHPRVLRLLVGPKADQGQRDPRADRNRGQPGLRPHPRGIRHRRADGALRSEDHPH